MATGFEVPVARALAPLIGYLAKHAKDGVSSSFQKWKAEGFSKILAKKLIIADKVKTIWSRDRESSLLSIYYPSKIYTENNVPQLVESLNDFSGGNYVVQGIVGQGKSMFIRYLYLQELAGRGTGTLPIFVELRTLTEKRTLDDHINDAIEKMDLVSSIDVFDYLAKSGKVTLLLDGFDEINTSLVPEVITRLEYFAEKYTELRIIVTSRPSAEIQKSRLFKTLILSGLRKNEYMGFLKKLNISNDKATKIISAISENSHRISKLISTPLMLTLLVMVYESEKEIPSDIPEFFDKLFTTVFTQHDKLKAGFVREHYSGISERKLQLLFESFCFVVIMSRMGRSLTSEEFNQAFEKAKKHSSEINCDSESFKKDIVKFSCLMLEEGYDMLTFLHKSISEYFAAAYISRASEGMAKKFYAHTMNSHLEWIEVLRYLEKIDPYRFSKFYTVPSITNFFDSMKSTENDETTSTTLFEKYVSFCPNSFIEFRNFKEDNLPEQYTQMGYANFMRNNAWSSEIYESFIESIIQGLRSDIPETLSLTDILAEGDFFSPIMDADNIEDKIIAFNISLENSMKRYGKKGTEIALRKLEESFSKKLEIANALINTEDSKQEILDIFP